MSATTAATCLLCVTIEPPITVKTDPKLFLNMNVNMVSPSKIHLSSEAYIESMADRYVPDSQTGAAVHL